MTEEPTSPSEDLHKLILRRIEGLRPKLLDLSRRNPLISTKFSPRSTSYIRVVDELPDVLYLALVNQQQMRFIALPPLDDHPKDENTREFQEALTDARLTDEAYLLAADQLDPSADNHIEESRKLERNLRDRLRDRLGMPPRQTKNDLSLTQHAKNNDISPSYELPQPSDKHGDGRHTDSDIQTLLLPDDMERKFNALIAKCRTWIQETGINVLHAAFGFLEYRGPQDQDRSVAPLILLPVEIEKKKRPTGPEFRVAGNGGEAETNMVLAEKLAQDFGLELPKFSAGSIEEYFQEISEISPPSIHWKVRREIAFGVFPSARMAMYYDLDTSRVSLSHNGVISSLFGGTEGGACSPFADEYAVDDPEIEQHVPSLVLEADSSQFSTIVDVVKGRNVAVEGPPGTGKSQTIVNTIAAALAEGKKVLFVAEKLAALDVVKSRLEAIQLGEFTLPFQAERSSQTQVIQSIRDRLEMAPGRVSPDYESQVSQFRETRSQLAAYVDTISMVYGQTGFTKYDILGKSIKTGNRLEGKPRPLQRPVINDLASFDRSKIDSLRTRGREMEMTWRDAESALPHWRGLRIPAIDRFTVDRLCQLAGDAAELYHQAAIAREALTSFSIDPDVPTEDLEKMEATFRALIPDIPHIDAALVGRLCRENRLTELGAFLDDCKQVQRHGQELAKLIADVSDEDTPNRLRNLHDLCVTNDIEILDIHAIRSRHQRGQDRLSRTNALASKIEPFVQAFPESALYLLRYFRKARRLVSATPRHILALRHDVTADPQAALVVRRAAKEGKQLRNRRAELESFMSVGHDGSAAQFAGHAATLRAAGLFGGFSSSFKAAKQTYLGLSRRKVFKPKVAADDFFALAEWREEEAKFLSDQQIKSVFGLQFQGIDTDFSLFEELLSYYETVDNDFPGAHNGALRNFLKTGDLDLVLAIPNTDEMAVADADDDDSLPATYHDLKNEIRQLTDWALAFGRAIDELQGLLEHLNYASNIIVSSLPSLAKSVEEYLQKRHELNDNQAMQELLGNRFDGEQTTTSEFDRDISVGQAIASLNEKEIALRLVENGGVAESHKGLSVALASESKAAESLDALCREASIDGERFTRDRSYHEVAESLREASRDRDGVFTHSALEAARRELDEMGFNWVVEALLEDRQPLDDLPDLLEATVTRGLAIEVYREHGHALTRNNGAKLNELRSELARLDQGIIKMSRQHIRRKIHSDARPPRGNGIGKRSTWTELALIEHEVSKKLRFIPLRDLTSRATRALLELKPCWMMSPLAVAQYIPDGTAQFDLCIIDEASQMPPEEAVGALMRSSQVMVVGDTNQLPPTNFFRKMVDDDENDEDEAVLEESILEMANATFRPKRRLRWHYRSRHSALINFSNHLIYNNDLIVFPAASEERPGMGISYQKINGRYSGGLNTDEASVIVESILRFMRSNPDRSLGVVTLNQKQRELLLEKMDYAIKFDSIAADYIECWRSRNDGLESFFVKNLENVQGDERDVIYISTVYGPERPGGPVMQRFGPINGLAGVRRLNVLFSRAKQQIVTFSSMSSDDIKADENGNAGAYMLKRWLEYCETGILHTGEQTSKEPDSDFELYVIDQIRSLGCEAVPQVGVAGYFVDIGVKHPDWPHGFLMAVECDGATYHSAKSARDRDRLRQEVLEGLGWYVHRIWSTDWFTDPTREASRLRQVIKERLDQLQSKAAEFTVPQATVSPFSHAATNGSAPERPEVDLFETTAANASEAPPGDSEDSLASATTQQTDFISVGDRVRVRYLTDNQKTVEVTLSHQDNEPARSILHVKEPLAQALLGAEEGDEIEVLIGSYVRKAIIERVVKGKGENYNTARDRDRAVNDESSQQYPSV